MHITVSGENGTFSASTAIEVVPRIQGVRWSVWIGLGEGLPLTFGLWVLVDGVLWLRGQAQVAAETGKRAVGVAIEWVEKSVPDAKESLGV